MKPKTYYIGVRIRDCKAIILSYDPETRKDVYYFGFGPFFNYDDTLGWMRHWGLR